jgi:AAA domain
LRENTTSLVQSDLERRLLSAALVSRSNYEQITESLESTDLGAVPAVVARLLSEYYSCDKDAGACPKEVLIGRVHQSINNPKHLETIANYVQNLDERVSVPNLLLDIQQQKRVRVGDKLAGLLANRAVGNEVDSLIAQYQELGLEKPGLSDDSESLYSGIEVGDLINRRFISGTSSFGLKLLDDACDGGARPGHHILVFARPEVGKTLFTLDLVSRKLIKSQSVLYIGNEDPMSDIVLRVVGRLSGMSKRDIYRDPEQANSLAFGRGYGGFVGASLSPGTYEEIGRLVDKYLPSVVVLDQLRNIDVGDDNRVTGLEKAAIGARNLAKSRSCIVISVTQAGESAEGRSHLDLSDIDFSKTGIPGAIDLAIGIGATHTDRETGFRTISLPKNKLGGQHTSFQVKFNTKTGTVEEI